MDVFTFFIVIMVFSAIIVALVTGIVIGKSQNKRRRDDGADTVHPADDAEDALFTGIILGSMLDDDSSGDTDSGGSDADGFDGGFDDGGGFDGGGFE